MTPGLAVLKSFCAKASEPPADTNAGMYNARPSTLASAPHRKARRGLGCSPVTSATSATITSKMVVARQPTASAKHTLATTV
jgi:hypothetical protein